MNWNAQQSLEMYPDKSEAWRRGYLEGAMHEAYGPDSLTPDLRDEEFAAGFHQGAFNCSMHGMSGNGCATIGLPLRPPFSL